LDFSLCESALPAAIFEALPVLLLRKTFDAAEAAFLPVTFFAIVFCINIYLSKPAKAVYLFYIEKSLSNMLCIKHTSQAFLKQTICSCLVFVIFSFFWISYYLFLFFCNKIPQ
jgi:hypothetical protein